MVNWQSLTLQNKYPRKIIVCSSSTASCFLVFMAVVLKCVGFPPWIVSLWCSCLVATSLSLLYTVLWFHSKSISSSKSKRSDLSPNAFNSCRSSFGVCAIQLFLPSSAKFLSSAFLAFAWREQSTRHYQPSLLCFLLPVGCTTLLYWHMSVRKWHSFANLTRCLSRGLHNKLSKSFHCAHLAISGHQKLLSSPSL